MTDMHEVAIETKNLAKRYDGVEALKEVSFDVFSGEIFGFLGPNGAGKTTTINILTGLTRCDKGRIRYFGCDYTVSVKKAQHLMGIVPDESNLYPELNGFENLCFCASLYGIAKREREQRAGELLEWFGLSDVARRKFGGYSRGMKRRLTIAAGIIHRPGILFLDEPTTGIDVANARSIRKLIAALKVSGTTVFLTTHYIEEAQRLCDRIAFIVNGQIVQIGTTAGLLRQMQENFIIELTTTDALPTLPEGIGEEFPDVTFEQSSPQTVRAITKKALPLAPLINFLEKRGIPVIEARAVKPSLEDVFVGVTGIEAGRMKAEKERKATK